MKKASEAKKLLDKLIKLDNLSKDLKEKLDAALVP